MSKPTLRWRIKNVFGVAIDWRVRDILEAEREATIELGKTFVLTSAQLTDEVRMLEKRVVELETAVRELKKDS